MTVLIALPPAFTHWRIETAVLKAGGPIQYAEDQGRQFYFRKGPPTVEETAPGASDPPRRILQFKKSDTGCEAAVQQSLSACEQSLAACESRMATQKGLILQDSPSCDAQLSNKCQLRDDAAEIMVKLLWGVAANAAAFGHICRPVLPPV